METNGKSTGKDEQGKKAVSHLIDHLCLLERAVDPVEREADRWKLKKPKSDGAVGADFYLAEQGRNDLFL